MKKAKLRLTISPFMILFAIIWYIMGNFSVFIYYFVSLLLHECAHAFVARRLGYRADKITLSPLGATLHADTDEFTSLDEFKIAIAGPIFSAMLAIFCVCVWWIYPESYNYTLDFCMANFSICVLNFLPVFPLDGGRVLSAKLSQNMSRKNVARNVNLVTIIFASVLILCSFLTILYKFNYTFGVIGIFLICSVVSGKKENSYKRILNLEVKSKKIKHGYLRLSLMVSKDLSIAKTFSLLDLKGYYEIVVVDDNFNVLYVIEEKDFVEILKTWPSSTPIGHVHIDK